MSKEKMLASVRIVFETDVIEIDRNQVVLSNTYLFDRLSIENIEAEITLSDGRKIKFEAVDWDVKADEDYFEDENNS